MVQFVQLHTLENCIVFGYSMGGYIALYTPGATSWTKLAEIPVTYPCDLRWVDSKTLSFRTSEGFYKPLGPERHVTLEAGQWVLKP